MVPHFGISQSGQLQREVASFYHWLVRFDDTPAPACPSRSAPTSGLPGGNHPTLRPASNTLPSRPKSGESVWRWAPGVAIELECSSSRK
jgi:hypothetical protein